MVDADHEKHFKNNPNRILQMSLDCQGKNAGILKLI